MKKLFYFLLAISLITGCKKEITDKAANPVATGQDNLLAEKKFSLEMLYGLQTDEMNDAMIQQNFSRLFPSLSGADTRIFMDQMKPLMERKSMGSTKELSSNRGLHFPGVETILPVADANIRSGIHLAADDNTLFVGAPKSDKVYVYRKAYRKYTLIQTLTPDIPGKGFGASVAISGNWLAVGATLKGFETAPNFNTAGKVLLFKRHGDKWIEKDSLTIPVNIWFGEDVAMDENRLAVMTRVTSQSDCRVVVYKYPGKYWDNDHHGYEWGDNHHGNNWDDEDDDDDQDRGGNGHNRKWTEETQLGQGQFFWDIDMKDGRIVFNGGVNPLAQVINGALVFNPSKLSVYKREHSAWNLEGQVVVPGAVPRSVAIDGNTAVANNSAALLPIVCNCPQNGKLGTFLDSNTYVFKRNDGAWEFKAQLLTREPGNFVQTTWLAINDGKIAAAAATGLPSAGPGLKTGDAVYVFEGYGRNWSLTKTITPSDGGLDYSFGEAVLIADHQVVVGALGSSPTTGGRVYIYPSR